MTSTPTIAKWQPLVCQVDGETFAECTLELTQQNIHLGPMTVSKPDPAWCVVDVNRHFHAFDSDGKTPTLAPITQEVWCLDCDEFHDETSFVCALCAEQVSLEAAYRTITETNTSLPGERSMEVRVPKFFEVQSKHSVVCTTNGLQFFGIMLAVESRRSSDESQNFTLFNGMLSQRLRRAK